MSAKKIYHTISFDDCYYCYCYFVEFLVKGESCVQSHSDLDCKGSIPAIPNARYVPSLLCHERFNEASLPVAFLYIGVEFMAHDFLVLTICRATCGLDCLGVGSVGIELERR
jgi:hypothetical protein